MLETHWRQSNSGILVQGYSGILVQVLGVPGALKTTWGPHKLIHGQCMPHLTVTCVIFTMIVEEKFLTIF